MQRDRDFPTTLSPEVRLLLFAAGPPAADAAIHALINSGEINWESLLDAADAERATAILWRRIRNSLPPDLRPAVRARFERSALVADFTSSYMEQRAGETLSALASIGIVGVLLKGAALAETVYGSYFERPMGDIDLLVEPTQAQAAWRLAQSSGWQWDAARYPLANYERHAHLPPLQDSKGGILRLELHSSLFVAGSPFPLSERELRERGREITVGHGAARAVVPCREHLLLHTCVHFAWSHMLSFGAWRSFRDVVALASAGIDWGFFEAEVQRNRAASSAYWTLHLAKRLASADVPSDTIHRLARSTDSMARGLTERHLEGELFSGQPECPSVSLRRLLWEAAIRPGRSSHGSARPWNLDDVGGVGEVARRGVHERLTQIGATVRYLRRLVD